MIRTFTAIACCTALACAGSDSPETGGSRRADWTTAIDTVGDTVIVRTTGGSDAASAQTLMPEITIGDSEGADEFTFGGITEVEVGQTGTIYVFDRQVPALRMYDTAGRYIRLVGRKGGGPGEYEAANGLAVDRDGRIMLWDAGKASINVYTASGEPDTSWSVPGGGGFYTNNAVYADTAGNTYIRTNIADPPKAANVPQSRVFGLTGLVKWNAAGEVVDSIAPPENSVEPAYIIAQNKGSTSRSSVPFATSFVWTFSPFGYFVSARTDRYAVTLSHPNGQVTRVERDVEPIAVVGDERADAELIATTNMRRTDPTWRWSGEPIPSTKPFIRSILVAEDGRIWVSVSQPGEPVPEEERTVSPSTQTGDRSRMPDPKWRQPLVYDVFEPDGRYLGRIKAPAKTNFRAMRGDHVWAVARDSLDVEQIVRYRVTPGFRDRAR
jgi:hypothetical protein